MCKTHTLLKQIFNYAYELEFIIKNPCINLIKPKKKEISLNYWNEEEIKTYLDILKPCFLYNVILFALTTGLRSGEICSLTWNDVDLNTGILNVDKTMEVRTGTGIIIKKPKTKKSIRKIILFKETLITLNKLSETSPNKHDFIFKNSVNNHFSPNTLSRAFLKTCLNYNLKKIRFHDLRHSFATMLLRNGIDIKLISDILGHASPTFTLRTYTHSSSLEEQQKIISKINIF